MEESKDIHCIVSIFLMVLVLDFGIFYIVKIPTLIKIQEVYQVTFSNFLACLRFVFIKGARLGNGRKKWIIYKHLYFILQNTMSNDIH